MNIIQTVMAIACTTIACALVGCDKELPTPEKIKSVSILVGKTAGYASEFSKMSASTKESIMNVLDIVASTIPTNGATFSESWMPIIDIEVQKLVDANKLKSSEVTVVKIALTAASSGIDYVFTKYPKAKEVKALIDAALEGFISGYKSPISLASGTAPDIDEDAFNFIKARTAAK